MLTVSTYTRIVLECKAFTQMTILRHPFLPQTLLCTLFSKNQKRLIFASIDHSSGSFNGLQCVLTQLLLPFFVLTTLMSSQFVKAGNKQCLILYVTTSNCVRFSIKIGLKLILYTDLQITFQTGLHREKRSRLGKP